MITHVGLSLAGRLASGNRTVKDNVMGFMFGLLVSGITFLVLKELKPQDTTGQFIPEWNTKGQNEVNS